METVSKIGFFFFANRLAKRFVAGEKLEDAAQVAKVLKQRGEKSVINILGEHVKDFREAAKFRNQIIELIALLAQEGLTDVHVAEKPSQLGLDISEFLYRANKIEILKAAQRYLPNSLVETDAEDHFYRPAVLKIVLGLSGTFQNQLLACQINRRGAPEEIRLLNQAGVSVRLCKGNAYPGDVKSQKELRRIFLEQAPLLIEQGKLPAFATHDLFLIDSIVESFGSQKERFEFDLLLGIEENLPREPGKEGLTFRRYLPCGPNWRPYGKRRADSIPKIFWRNWWYRRKERRCGSAD